MGRCGEIMRDSLLNHGSFIPNAGVSLVGMKENKANRYHYIPKIRNNEIWYEKIGTAGGRYHTIIPDFAK